MRSAFIPISIIVLFLVLQQQAFAAEKAAGPEVHFPETAAEFLPVHEGAHVELTFAVRNRGIAALTILNVKTD